MNTSPKHHGLLTKTLPLVIRDKRVTRKFFQEGGARATWDHLVSDVLLKFEN